jgi:hypothetical protein
LAACALSSLARSRIAPFSSLVNPLAFVSVLLAALAAFGVSLRSVSLVRD